MVQKHVNNGINYQPQLVNAGFLNHQPYQQGIAMVQDRAILNADGTDYEHDYD